LPNQVQLYEDFAKSRAKLDVDDVISTTSTQEEEEKPKLKATGHVFQVDLRKSYKRKNILLGLTVCNVGVLVFSGSAVSEEAV